MRTKLAPSLLLLMAVTMLALPVAAQTADTPTAAAAPTAATAAAPIPRVRDPFWPVGYVPRGKQPVAPKPTASRELSDQEMQELIRREQDSISKMMVENGRIVRGNKVYVIIRGLLVTEGDVLEVDVDGVFYKLVIKSLSENNIRLEPIRQNKPK
jgi:hypothetical protein